MRNPSKRLVLAMIALVWSTLFLSFGVLAVDAAGLKSVSNLRVFDANNKLLGRVESFQGDGDVQVVLKMDQSVFYVKVLRTGFTSEETLYYQSDNCTGLPLDDVDDGGDILQEGIIGPPGGTAYLKDPSATPQSYTIKSVWTEDDDDDTSVRLCRVVTPYTEEKIQTIPIINLLDLFTPPFSVR